jgi:hypothetical protein
LLPSTFEFIDRGLHRRKQKVSRVKAKNANRRMALTGFVLYHLSYSILADADEIRTYDTYNPTWQSVKETRRNGSPLRRVRKLQLSELVCSDTFVVG